MILMRHVHPLLREEYIMFKTSIAISRYLICLIINLRGHSPRMFIRQPPKNPDSALRSLGKMLIYL